MALTPSNQIPLGTIAPDFTLTDTVSGNAIHLRQLAGKATLVMFICNHCPFVKHVQHELVRLANDYMPRGIAMVAISSNDVVNYPADAPDKMKLEAQRLGYPFPYTHDESQDVARRYKAACTPEFYLFDADRALVYRGQLDDSRPGNDVPVTGRDLRAAMDAVLAGKPVNPDQRASVGCNIKWKPAS